MNDPDLMCALPLKNRLLQFYLNIKTVFATKKWRLLSKLIFAYFKIHVLKQMPLRFADIAVGYGCNLNCVHCSSMKLNKENLKPLSLAEYKRLAEDFKRMGIVQIDFTGGEPTIYPHLEELVAIFNPASTYVSISTNGIGPLTREKLLRYRKAGVDSLMVSVDSIDPDEHDAFRQKRGALSETLGTVGLAKKLGFSVFVCIVIHHRNLYSKKLDALLAFTRKNGIIINFALAVPAGNWNDFECFKKDFMLTKKDKIYVREVMKKNYHARFDFSINLKKWGCPAAAEKIYITPYGDVMPCPFIQVSFGNVRNESILSIRKRMLEEKRISEYFNQCLAAEDEVFIHRYLSKTFGQKDLPVPYEKVFIDSV